MNGTRAQKLGFVIGEKYRVISGEDDEYSKVGDVVEFVSDDDTYCPWFRNISRPDANGGDTVAINLADLGPAEKTLKTLLPGDIIGTEEYPERNRFTVLFATPDVVIYHRNGDLSDVYTQPVIGLEKDGWMVEQPEEPIKEITLEEVAKLAGVPVEFIRIKD